MPLAAIRSRFAPITPAAGPADAPPGAERCVTCGRPAGTPYCPRCGERRAGDRPVHVRELFEELWGSFVSIDGRVVRSFCMLVRHPGALTAAYLRGERRPYLTPLGVFFSVNALFFVFATAHGFNGFTAPLASHLNDFRHHEIAQRLVNARLAARHVSMTTYASAFDAVVANQSKTLLLALVPIFAAFAMIVQLPRRRPALQHVAFALHAVSAWLLSLMATYYALAYGVRYTLLAALWLYARLTPTYAANFRLGVGDGTFGLLAGAMFFAWLAPALRRRSRALLFFTAFWAT